MNIGTLTGQITLEDKLSGSLMVVSGHVKQFAKEFDGMTKAILIGAGAAVAGVASLTAGIIALGMKGSVINGVEAAFDSLAKKIGSSGEELFAGLNAGVKGTVDSMELMQSTTRLLSSGIKLTADDMQTLGATAREMGKATGTDAAQGLQILSQALLTGNQRRLKMFGINVDLAKAEKEFARQIGSTREQLSEAGKLEARRIAFMDASRKKLELLGESELNFKERVQQTNVAIGNWFDNLAKAIDKSDAVNDAFIAIKDAFTIAFGDGPQKLLEAIIDGINKFATGVRQIAPVVVSMIETVRTKIVEIWNELVDFNERWQITNNLISIAQTAWSLLQKAFALVKMGVDAVVKAWSSMPEWMQKLTQGALEAALALGAYGIALGATATAVKGAFIGSVDLAINILGNFTGAIYSTIGIFKEWGLTIGKVGDAYRIMSTAITANTAVVVVNTTATKAMAAAEAFWGGALTVLSAKLGITTVLMKVQTAATGFLAAAKAQLAAIILSLNITYTAYAARLAAVTAGTTASTVAITASNVALVAMGTALAAVKFVLLPLVAAWGAWKLGEWLASFPSVQRAILWMVEKIGLMSSEAVNARREMLDLADGIAKVNTGYQKPFVRVTPDMNDDAINAFIEQMERLGKAQGFVNEELTKFVQDAVDRMEDLKDNGSRALAALNAQFHLLAASGNAPQSAWRKLAMAAKELQDAGTPLGPQMRELVRMFNLTGPSAAVAAEGLTKVIDVTEGLASKLSGHALAKEIKSIHDNLAAIGGAGKANVHELIQLARQLETLRLQGGRLTPELQRVRDTYLFVEDAVKRATAMMALQKPVIHTNTMAWFQWVTAMRNVVEAKKAFFANMGTLDISPMPRFGAPVEEILSRADTGALKTNTTAALKDIADAHRATYDEMMKHPERYSRATRLRFKEIADAANRAANGVRFSWREAIDLMVDGFEQLGNIAGESLNDITRGVGTLIGSFEQLTTAMDIMKDAKGAKGGIDWGGMVAGMMSFVGAIAAAVQAAIALGKALKDAFSRSEAEKAAADIRRQWGTIDADLRDIQEDDPLAKRIEQMVKDLRISRGDATNILMPELVNRAGGIDAKNFQGFNQSANALFDIIAKGRGAAVGSGFAEAAEMAQESLDSMFKSLGDHLVETGGLWDSHFIAMIARAKAEGLELKNVMEVIRKELDKLGPATANVAKGFSFTLGTAFFKQLPGTTASDRTDLMEKTSGGEKLTRQEQERLDKIKKTNADIVANYQTEFDRVSRITLAAFSAEIANGASTVEAVRNHKAAIDELVASQETYGFATNAAFDQLSRWSGLVETNAPLLDQVSSLNDIMTVLANTGGLTAESFADLQAQGAATFSHLLEAGFTENEALAQQIPFLETVLELHAERGLAIDSETQAMINQARQSGLLTDKQLTTNDILMQGIGALIKALGGEVPAAWEAAANAAKTATDKMNGSVAGTVEAISGDLASAVKSDEIFDPLAENAELAFMEAEKAAQDAFEQAELAAEAAALGITNALEGIKIPDILVPVEFDVENQPRIITGESEYFSKGGVVYAASGFRPRGTDTVPAMLTPGERVLSVEQNRQFEQGLLGGDDDRPINLTIPVFVGQELLQEFVVETTLRKLERNDGGGAPVGPLDRLAKAVASRISVYQQGAA